MSGWDFWSARYLSLSLSLAFCGFSSPQEKAEIRYLNVAQRKADGQVPRTGWLVSLRTFGWSNGTNDDDEEEG